MNVGIYPNLKYYPLKSFVPISMVATVNNLLVVNPSVPVNELIDFARKNPSKLNYASGGNGSAAHIAMAAFADTAKIELTHVPYRGTNPAVTDVIAGHVQLTLTGATALLERAQRQTACIGSRRFTAPRVGAADSDHRGDLTRLRSKPVVWRGGSGRLARGCAATTECRFTLHEVGRRCRSFSAGWRHRMGRHATGISRLYREGNRPLGRSDLTRQHSSGIAARIFHTVRIRS